MSQEEPMSTDQLAVRAAELRQQLSDRPEDPQACAELATVTAQLGDYASAIDHDARAWALRPDDPAPIQHILAILVDSGKWLGAMTAFEIVRQGARAETAFALDLAAAQVFRRITNVFPPRGAHQDADRLIERLVANSCERSVAAQTAVVRSLIDLGRISDASALLERIATATASTNDRAHIYFLRAALCERAGDSVAAISFYEQALALDARRSDAAINLISMLLESPDPDASTRIATVLSRLDASVRELPEVRFNEAIHLRRIGEQEDARALLALVAADRTTELGRVARQVLASC